MANLPTLENSPLLPSPSASLRGLDLTSTGVLSGQLARNEQQNTGLQYIAKGLGDVADAADFVQVEDDKRNAKDNLTSYSQELRTTLYGDGTDQNPGYYNLMGDDAVKQRGTYQTKIEGLRQKYLTKSDNKQSARLFNDASQAVTAPELDNIAQHSAKQKMVAFQASSQAASDEASSRFMANPTNETIRAQSQVIVTNEALSQADMAGIKDPVARANAVRTSLSKMYSGAVLTEVQRDVDAGRHLYEKLQGTIDGDDQAKLENAIHTEEAAKDAKIEHQAVMGRLAAEEADKQAFGKVVSDLIAGKNVDAKQIAADPSMDGSSKITAFNLMKSIDKGEPDSRISRVNTADAYSRMFLPDTDPRKITDTKQLGQMLIAGKFGRTDLDWLNARLQENQSASGLKENTRINQLFDSVKKRLVYSNSLGVESGLGAEQYYNFQQYAYDKIKNYKDNNKDIDDLLRPGSKDFLGNQNSIKQFTIPFDQQMNSTLSTYTGATVAADTVNENVYKSPDDVLNALSNGEITRAAARKYFDAHGMFRHRATPSVQGTPTVSPIAPSGN